jgi:hypothetical protein
MISFCPFLGVVKRSYMTKSNDDVPRVLGGLVSYSFVKSQEAKRHAAAMAADPVAETARRQAAYDAFIKMHKRVDTNDPRD